MCISQQDEAKIYSSHYTASRLRDHGVLSLKWPALSSGFNTIQKIRSVIARRVYSQKKQFSSTGELEQAIPEVKQGPDAVHIRGLYYSILWRSLAAIISSERTENFQHFHFSLRVLFEILTQLIDSQHRGMSVSRMF